LHAQATFEYGAAAGSAAASSAAGAGKSVVTIFGKVNKTLAEASKVDEAPKLSASQPAKSAAVAKPAKPAPPPDLAALSTGMDRADMLAKVGKPSMSMSSVESSAVVETCWYKSGGDSVAVILRDGKVASFDTVSQPKP
jgi:hypothetical protein